MIPVALQSKPDDFDQRVRQPGRTWLAAHNIALDAAPPRASSLPNYWTHSNKQLWEAYSGVCAYLAIYFEWVTGAASTDHFVAKSKHAGDAYEWDNYRLSCLGPNRNKGKFDDVLDPIGLQPDTFVLNLSNGKIRPNPSLGADRKRIALKTIKRLKLDSPDHNAMRAKFFSRYLRCKDEQSLKELCPFVWHEAQRQGLL
jgi:uncharacterized protein (TIGR02646 family)